MAKKPEPKKPAAKPVAKVPAVAAKKSGGVPATIAEQMKLDAGKGVSTAQEDNLVPLIYVLQPLSPQVDEADPRHVDGAKPGSIWLKSAPEPIIDGDAGIIFQPCFFQKNWVEWIPRDKGGGLVAITEDCPKEATAVKDNNVTRYVMPNGNEVKETRYHYGYVFLGDQRLPYCIPLTSTGHTVSRDLMTRMRGKMQGDVRAPSWAFLYRLTTVSKTNKKGKWNIFVVEDVDWVENLDDYNNGKALFNSLDKGEKKAALDEDAATVGEPNDNM